MILIKVIMYPQRLATSVITHVILIRIPMRAETSTAATIADVVKIGIDVVFLGRIGKVFFVLVCFTAFVAECIIVRISMLTSGGIGNILAVLVRLAANITEGIVISITMLADRYVYPIRVRLLAKVTKIIIVRISVLTSFSAAGYAAGNEKQGAKHK